MSTAEQTSAQAESPAVNELLTLAQSLQKEHKSLTERRAANREVLRGYVKMGLANPEQVDAIEAFYPTPKRGEKTDATPAADPAAAAKTKAK